MNRVCLVGFGGIGSQDHQNAMYLPAFTAHPAYTVVGAVDVAGTEGAEKAARDHGLRHFTDLDAAFAAADVVSVAAPLAARAGVVSEAVRAGRHVLADKPLAATLADAEEIGRLAAAHNVVVVPAHHIRLGGALRAARAAIRSGRIGLPWNVQCDFLVAGGDPVPTGELVNLAVHPIDALYALLDLEVHSVRAIGDALLLTYENGVTGTILFRRIASLHGVPASGLATHRYRISGSHGMLTVDATKPALRVRNATRQTTAWTGPSTVDALLDVLTDGIRTGEPEIGVADAVRVQRVVDAALGSDR